MCKIADINLNLLDHPFFLPGPVPLSSCVSQTSHGCKPVTFRQFDAYSSIIGLNIAKSDITNKDTLQDQVIIIRLE